MTTAEWRKRAEKELGRKMTRSERRCVGKKPMSQLRAEVIAYRYREQFSKRYRAYKCPQCGMWHVGRRRLG